MRTSCALSTFSMYQETWVPSEGAALFILLHFPFRFDPQMKRLNFFPEFLSRGPPELPALASFFCFVCGLSML